MLSQRDEYVAIVDEMIIQYIKAPDDKEKSVEEHFEQRQNKFRAFFTLDVIAKKWSIYNWLFVRRAIEHVMNNNQIGKRDQHLQLLNRLFDKVATPGNGFAAMDFGYAFDSLIWDVLEQQDKFADYNTNIAVIIVEAIRMDVIPYKYLQDAETLTKSSSAAEDLAEITNF